MAPTGVALLRSFEARTNDMGRQQCLTVIGGIRETLD